MGEDTGQISVGMGFAMIFVAAFIDGIQILLTVFVITALANPFIDIMTGLLFWLWFWHLGVKVGLGMGGVAVAEFWPGLGAVPLWTIYVVVVVGFNITSRTMERISSGGGFFNSEGGFF